MARQTAAQRWCSLGLLAALISLVLFHGGPELLFQAGRAWESGRRSVREDVPPGAAVTSGTDESEAVRALSARVRPAVVRVEALREPREVPATFAAEGDPQARDSVAWSCGVILDSTGLVLTNYASIIDARSVRIHLPGGGGVFTARPLAGDDDTDLALLRLEAPPAGLPAIEWSGGPMPDVGERAVAVGHATHPDQFLWVGTVLGAGRDAPATSCGPADFIHTTAADPRNIGGPLLNARGELIGFTSTWVIPRQEFPGLAIPASAARRVVEALLAEGRIERGWLGAFLHAVDLGSAVDERGPAVAACVDYVVPHSPAAEGGLRARDLIVRIGERSLSSLSGLRRLIAEASPGVEVRLTVRRAGDEFEQGVAVGSRPESGAALPGEREWGLRPMCHVPPELGQALGLREGPGVVVQSVAGGCRVCGLRPGDVIEAVDGAPIATLDDLARAVDAWSAQPSRPAVELAVRSGTARRKLVLTLPAGTGAGH